MIKLPPPLKIKAKTPIINKTIEIKIPKLLIMYVGYIIQLFSTRRIDLGRYLREPAKGPYLKRREKKRVLKEYTYLNNISF